MFIELARSATFALASQKLRAGLAVLGIAVGTAAIIALMGIGAAAQKTMLNQVERYGPDMLVVTPKKTVGPDGADPSPVLTQDDYNAVLSEDTYIHGVVPVISDYAFVSRNMKSRLIPVVGTWNGWIEAQATRLISGRPFNDYERSAFVCILAYTTYRKLFGDHEPVGHYISVGDVPLRVVGLMERKPMSGEESANDLVVVPFQTAAFIFKNTPALSSIVMRAVDRNNILSAQVAVYDILKRRHAPSDYNIQSQASYLSIATHTGRSIKIFLIAVALGMLFVGGVGVMNTMLVAVKDRTREIGIRRAVGATKTTIRLQFLLESVIICLSGCTMGVVFGLVAGYVMVMAVFSASLNPQEAWACTFSLTAIVASVLAATITGILSGLIPASKAASIQAAESLRYD